MGKTFDSIVGFFITAAVLTVLFFSISWVSRFIDYSPRNQLPTDVITPVQEVPTVKVYLVELKDKKGDLDTMINAFLVQNEKHVGKYYGVFNINVYDGKTVWIIMETIRSSGEDVPRITALPSR